MLLRADRVRLDGRWQRNVVLAVEPGRISPLTVDRSRELGNAPLPRLAAAVLPPVTDAHVHTGLSDLRPEGHPSLARVLDLGSVPSDIAALARSAQHGGSGTEFRFAGAFLTAPGGYPSDRAWAATGSWVEVDDADAAARAVTHQVGHGADVIKVALNASAGPVPSDALLAAVVAAARAARKPVVAHVEGPGQVERALGAGLAAFAHTPWQERLDDGLLARLAGSLVWISTLDMHARAGDERADEVAGDNLARFIAAGGRVLYGTDLGNGLTRGQLCRRELAALVDAGLSPGAVLDALCAPGLLPTWGRTVTVLEPTVATDDAALAALVADTGAARAAAAGDLLDSLATPPARDALSHHPHEKEPRP